MSSDRFQFRVAIYLLLTRDDEVLLARRYNTGWEDGKYSMVAGHLDGNETASEALVREAKEEADISIDISDVEVVHTMHRFASEGLEYIDFFATPKSWTGDPKVMEPDKCDEISWFSMNDLPEKILPHVKFAIECSKNKIHFSEYGWDRTITR